MTQPNQPTEMSCAHCGLPVPRGMVESGREVQFCCHGCRSVYAVLHGSGLDGFYRLRDASDATAVPARTTDRKYTEFADPLFRELHYESGIEGTQAVELYLEGVHCAACVWLLEKLPSIASGVLEARLDLRRSLLRVRWDETQIELPQIARLLDSLGYPPHPAKDARARQLQRQEDRRFLIRIGVAAACAGNVMTLSFALYGGTFTGIEAQYSQLFRLTSMLFGVIALVWPGNIFLRGAWAAIRTRSAHLDLPIALGLVAGGLMGTVNALLGRGEIYFDSLTMLVFLLLVGRWVQRRQQRWASDAVELLFSVTPSSARRVEGDMLCDVPLEALARGDLVEVRAGESLPLDGIVVTGTSSVDQSLLTGESQPISVGVGDIVHAGTTNLSAMLRIRATAVGSETRVGKLMQLVEHCSSNRAPLVLMADRLAGWFVLVVLVLAAITLLFWLWRDPSQAVDNAVALLIVCCPCALGLSTPLAIAVAIGRAARRRILVKGGSALELLAHPSVVVLDKTGTITEGRGRVSSFVGPDEIKPLVVALERHSSHPLAQAIQAAFDESAAQERVTCKPGSVQQTTGGGLEASVEGRFVLVGSADFVRSHETSIPAAMQEALEQVTAAGHTPVLVAVDREVMAVIGVGDPIRDDATAAITALRSLGHQIHILSGDHPAVVARVASQLGIPQQLAKGGATPEQKVAYIRQLAATRRTTVMVGDGVNDTAALAAASVGIAVHGGAEASLATADIYLSRPGLSPIVELMHAARTTVRTIRRSLMASLCYNVLAGTLAMAGVIGPLTAAILMPISSFTVVALALASRTFGATS